MTEIATLGQLATMKHPKPKAHANCPICGNAFIPSRSWQKYCSEKCRHKAFNQHRHWMKPRYMRHGKLIYLPKDQEIDSQVQNDTRLHYIFANTYKLNRLLANLEIGKTIRRKYTPKGWRTKTYLYVKNYQEPAKKRLRA